MKMVENIDEVMLAACGINCTVCYGHLRQKKSCPGCNRQDRVNKPESCRKCHIKACADGQGIKFCIECPTFPCERVKRLDKSYRKRYQVSLIENARRMTLIGIEPYLQEEKGRWICPACGGIICLHDRACSECGQKIEAG